MHRSSSESVGSALGLFLSAALVLTPLLALAQGDASTVGYVPPKVKWAATSSSASEGPPGTVVVEVLVRADGTFKVQRIVRSTNHDNDKAALDIVGRSSYKPATKGGVPLVSSLDVTLNFTGNGLNRYEQMIIGTGAYARAKSDLQAYLAKHPTDARAQLDLGIAESFTNDSADAVVAFDKAGVIPEKFKSIAVKAYSDRAVDLTNAKQYAQALPLAKKAVALSPAYETIENLAVAELGAGDTVSAIAHFQKSLALAVSEKVSATRRAAINANLAAAYAKGGDLENAKTYSAQAVQLAPSATGGYAAIAQAYVAQAELRMTAGKFAEAAALFEQAAAIAPSDVATLYTNAAFAHLKEKPKPPNDKAFVDAAKALAIDAKSARANYATGIALANQGKGKRKEALVYLAKADDAAKGGADSALTEDIEQAILRLHGSVKRLATP